MRRVMPVWGGSQVVPAALELLSWLTGVERWEKVGGKPPAPASLGWLPRVRCSGSAIRLFFSVFMADAGPSRPFFGKSPPHTRAQKSTSCNKPLRLLLDSTDGGSAERQASEHM